MIYLSIAECGKSHSDQHDTAHKILSSLLCQLGHKDHLICKEDNGRPYVSIKDTDISISHSRNLAVVCVANLDTTELDTDCLIALPIEAKRIGIDIEYIDKNADLNAKNRLAKRFLSKEASSIEEFFSIWTENEAVGKLTGEGVIQSSSAHCSIISFIITLNDSNDEYSLSIAYSDRGSKEDAV